MDCNGVIERDGITDMWVCECGATGKIAHGYTHERLEDDFFGFTSVTIIRENLRGELDSILCTKDSQTLRGKWDDWDEVSKGMQEYGYKFQFGGSGGGDRKWELWCK